MGRPGLVGNAFRHLVEKTDIFVMATAESVGSCDLYACVSGTVRRAHRKPSVAGRSPQHSWDSCQNEDSLKSESDRNDSSTWAKILPVDSSLALLAPLWLLAPREGRVVILCRGA